ncbi:MAG TPA: dihydrofolate reductase [Candidatus Acidoferrales bacterium]
MRRIRYHVAMSLDGYIAGPKGEADWITPDPEVDFAALFNEFDTALVGRRTFDAMVNAGRATIPGMRLIVFSRTLRRSDYPDATIAAEKQKEMLTSLRQKPGKDIWLFGGATLFQALLEQGFVDTVEVSIILILLGGGIPLLPTPATRKKLNLTSHKFYKSGILALQYAVGSSAEPRVGQTPKVHTKNLPP